jgi:hypothetical protein
MNRPRLELAGVVREYGDACLDRYGDVLSPEQRRALRDIAACRAAALGGHVEECDHCGHQQIAYNSCRNRHCPKCQASAAAEETNRRPAISSATLPPVRCSIEEMEWMQPRQPWADVNFAGFQLQNGDRSISRLGWRF